MRQCLLLLLVAAGMEVCLARSIASLKSYKEEKGNIISSNRNKRSLLLSRFNTKWRGNIVPYTFDETFTEDDKRQAVAAMKRWSDFTCIKFVPAARTTGNMLVFMNASGCGTYVGQTQPGRQGLFLRKECRNVPVVLHELGHTIGMVHEQQRPDRDSYVDIVAENILPTLQIISQFIRQDRIMSTTLRVPYDYNSIMHYPGRGFSFTGDNTIVTRDPKFQSVIGTATDLSFLDVKRVNLYLGCDESCSELKCPYHAYKGKECRCMCPDPRGKQPAIPCKEVGKIKLKTEAIQEDRQSLNVNERLSSGRQLTFGNTLQLQSNTTSDNSTTGTGNQVSSASDAIGQSSEVQNFNIEQRTKESDLMMLADVNNAESISKVVQEAAKFAIEENNYSYGRIFYI